MRAIAASERVGDSKRRHADTCAGLAAQLRVALKEGARPATDLVALAYELGLSHGSWNDDLTEWYARLDKRRRQSNRENGGKRQRFAITPESVAAAMAPLLKAGMKKQTAAKKLQTDGIGGVYVSYKTILERFDNV